MGNGVNDKLHTPKKDVIVKGINFSHTGVNGHKELTSHDTKYIPRKFKSYTLTNFISRNHKCVDKPKK